MNDQQRAAMQMALEAFDSPVLKDPFEQSMKLRRACDALREALAQPQGAPYGRCPICGAKGRIRERRIDGNDTCDNGHSYKSSLAVKAQPQVSDYDREFWGDGQDHSEQHLNMVQGEWVDLTDDELREMWNQSIPSIFNFARAVIVKFKEKNTPPVVLQCEPVAFVNSDYLQGLTLGHYGYAEIYTDESEGRIPLYTTPPSVEAAIEATKEKAAKVCESEEFAVWETAERIAAAIRSMKLW